MVFGKFKNYYILRYIIYEFLKKVLGVPQPTCLVRVFCGRGELPTAPASPAAAAGRQGWGGRILWQYPTV